MLTEVEVMLSLETSQRDILRVEGVTVASLVQPVQPLLPPVAVHGAGQVVPGVITTQTKYQSQSTLRLSQAPCQVKKGGLMRSEGERESLDVFIPYPIRLCHLSDIECFQMPRNKTNHCQTC